jgi:hypothetical protein
VRVVRGAMLMSGEKEKVMKNQEEAKKRIDWENVSL